MYVIPKSLHPLLRRIHKIIRKSRLGAFWQGVWRRYGRVVLDQGQVEWIIKARNEGKKNEDIARIQEVSIRRVQQLCGEYRKTGAIPKLKKAGRPREEISDDERRAVIDAYHRWKACACYLEEISLPVGLISVTGRYTGCSERKDWR